MDMQVNRLGGNRGDPWLSRNELRQARGSPRGMCVCLCRRPQALGDSAPTRVSVVGLAQEGEGFEASGRNPQSHKGGEQDLDSVAFVRRGVLSNQKPKSARKLNPGGRARVLDKQSALREAIRFPQ